MKSRRSASDFSRATPHDRKRLLARKPLCREFRTEDERWLWAAYAWEHSDKTQDDFYAEVMPQVYHYLDIGCSVWLLIAPHDGEHKPVGVVVGTDVLGSHDGIEPHVSWFPWASKRNKLEASVAWIDGVRRMRDIMIISQSENKAFFDAVEKYGVIRPVGKWERWFGTGDAYCYQSRRF